MYITGLYVPLNETSKAKKIIENELSINKDEYKIIIGKDLRYFDCNYSFIVVSRLKEVLEKIQLEIKKIILDKKITLCKLEIRQSNYACRYMVGVNIDEDAAINIQGILNIKYGLGQSAYEVLAGSQTYNYEGNYNLVITNYEYYELQRIMPLLEGLLKYYKILY